jgi:hypothetical protein
MRHMLGFALPYRDAKPSLAVDAPVEVRHHPGARRMTLRVSNTRRAVIVTMPTGVRPEEADRFLARHIDWVRDRLDALPQARPFESGGTVPLRGEHHLIRFAGPREWDSELATRDIVRVERAAAGQLPKLVVLGHKQHAPRRLRDWLVRQAEQDLGRRVTVHARTLGLNWKRLSVRDQTTRWGSCSTSGLLSFSWRLVLAPPHVLDYVAAHEVAHLKEMNHSARFWALVRQAMPDLDDAKDWLDRHGRELHAYGRET